MGENVNLNKQVYSKSQYSKIIDTEFKQLGVKSTQQQLNETPTVQDFFQLYNDLFYDIPEMGSNNSHEYLIVKSSEYINFEPNNEEIEALQAEIAQLRMDLFDEQKKVIELQIKTNI